MAIDKRGSGRYRVRIDARDANGIRHRIGVGTFRTRKEAERAERQALETRNRGIDLDPTKVTVREVVERFLKSIAPDLAPATLARYEELWRMHIAPSIGGIAIGNLRPPHLAELYARLRTDKIRSGKGETVRYRQPLSANSVLRIHRFLHRMFAWAERMNLVARNVTRSVEAPKATASPARALSAEQVDQVLAASEGTRYHHFFVICAETGMRRGEVGALVWDAVDFNRRVVTVRQAIGEDRRGGTFIKVPKNGRTREVPLSDAALEALRRQRVSQAAEKLAARGGVYVDRGFVFANEVGGWLDLDSVSKAFSALLRVLGIKARGLSLHSCRHFVGTTGLVQGNDVRTISDLLGHADPGVTLRVYGHAVAGAKERAVTSIGNAIADAKARRLAGEN